MNEKEESKEEQLARRNRIISEMQSKHKDHDYDCEGCIMLGIIRQLEQEATFKNVLDNHKPAPRPF